MIGQQHLYCYSMLRWLPVMLKRRQCLPIHAVWMIGKKAQSIKLPAIWVKDSCPMPRDIHLISPRVCTKAWRSSGLVLLLFKLSSRKARIWSSCSCGTYGERVAARHTSCLRNVKLSLLEIALLLLSHGSQPSALWYMLPVESKRAQQHVC